MITGKKVVHVPSAPDTPVEFLPSESFILQSNSEVYIDFPVATTDSPTTCLAIEISQAKIRSLAERMCEQSQLYAQHDQVIGDSFFHSAHNIRVQHVLENLVDLFSENETDRSLLVDLSITELIIRTMRTESYLFLLSQVQQDYSKSPLHLAIQRMKNCLCLPFDIDDLCKHAYVSRSKLYGLFRKELGSSPHMVFMQLRLERAESMLHGKLPIATICFDLGFVSESHFSRCFKAMYGCSPTAYRKRLQSNEHNNTARTAETSTK